MAQGLPGGFHSSRHHCKSANSRETLVCPIWLADCSDKTGDKRRVSRHAKDGTRVPGLSPPGCVRGNKRFLPIIHQSIDLSLVGFVASCSILITWPPKHRLLPPKDARCSLARSQFPAFLVDFEIIPRIFDGRSPRRQSDQCIMDIKVSRGLGSKRL